jgi:hypothetical protein
VEHDNTLLGLLGWLDVYDVSGLITIRCWAPGAGAFDQLEDERSGVVSCRVTALGAHRIP